jgi:hypothetical protein
MLVLDRDSRYTRLAFDSHGHPVVRQQDLVAVTL